MSTPTQPPLFGFSMPGGQITAPPPEIPLTPVAGVLVPHVTLETATRPAPPPLAPGTNTCYCTTCGELFNSVHAFDLHRVGDFPTPTFPTSTRRCLTEAEMREKGWDRNARGRWVTALWTGAKEAYADEDADAE